jgi:hypothetical protein
MLRGKLQIQTPSCSLRSVRGMACSAGGAASARNGEPRSIATMYAQSSKNVHELS